MHGASFWLRRSAGLLAVLWLCAWLTPLLHRAQCNVHDHASAPCAVCQLAATSVVESPAQTAPIPISLAVQQPLHGGRTAPDPLFQTAHPPRGPPFA